MKKDARQIFFDLLPYLLVCLPVVVFIGLCSGIFIAFIAALGTFSPTYPSIVGWSWLAIFVFYLILGIGLILFNARLIHSMFAAKGLRHQWLVAVVSGSPFVALAILFVLNGVVALAFPQYDMQAAQAWVSAVGFVGFSLVSLSYFVLVCLILARLSIKNKSIN